MRHAIGFRLCRNLSTRIAPTANRCLESRSKSFMQRTFVPIVLLALLLCSPATAAAPVDPVQVNVQRRGAIVVVDVQTEVAADVATAWAVLTDYEHMAAFISNLKTSVVLTRLGNQLEVLQSGQAKKGPLTFSFETTRAVELIPDREIRSHLIKGDFKSYDFTTTVVDTGSGVSIVNHGEYWPNVWVPPIVGPAMIESETRKQYGEIRAEILRRTANGRVSPR